MRFIKFLLILPILCYGGVKGYIWYNVKSNTDEQISKVSPFVEITYGGIYSSLIDGEVGLEDIVIRPKMTSDEFSIGEMSFSASDLISLATLRKQFMERKFPEYLGWSFKNIRMNLNSDIFDTMRQMSEQQANSRSSEKALLIERMDAMGCGNIESFGLDDYVAMGYNKTNADLDVGISYDETLEIMNIRLDLRDQGLYDATFKFKFPFKPVRFKPADPRSMEPDISVMNVEYTDTGYYKLRNKYCAGKRGGTVEEFVSANIQGFSNEIDAQFPENITKAYRQFMMNGGTVVMGIDPVESVKLSSMQFYKVSDALRLLSMSVSINGVDVDFDKVNWRGESGELSRITDKPEVKSKIAKSFKATVKPPSAGKPQTTNRPSRQYKSVDQARLESYVGKNVRIETSNGRVREGILESIDDRRIRIMVKYGSGDFSFPVRRDEIVKSSVYM